MLKNLSNCSNRNAEYRCAITVMFYDGHYNQFKGATKGIIDTKINEPIKKPYFYSLFIDKKTNTPFNYLTSEQLMDTYRYSTLTDALKFLDKEYINHSSMEKS
jgi:inosine/xanthosine triphosphate pyrophosphatase family protein